MSPFQRKLKENIKTWPEEDQLLVKQMRRTYLIGWWVRAFLVLFQVGVGTLILAATIKFLFT